MWSVEYTFEEGEVQNNNVYFVSKADAWAFYNSLEEWLFKNSNGKAKVVSKEEPEKVTTFTFRNDTLKAVASKE